MTKRRYIAGLRAVEQLLGGGGAEIRRLYAEHQTPNPRVEAIIATARGRGIEIHPANRARLSQISGDSRHQGVVAEVRRSSVLDEAGLRSLVESRLEKGAPLLLLVLDGVQDPHNLGACMRTADAAGVDAVIVPRRGAAGLGPTVSKVAAGAAEQLPFVPVANVGKTLDWLGGYGICRVGTSDRAETGLFEAELGASVALVMGREESGLSEAVASRCDALVSLPMRGVVASLNVSVATGICLYEIQRRRTAEAR